MHRGKRNCISGSIQASIREAYIGTANVNDSTVLHELGHAFNDLFGKGSSTIINDLTKTGIAMRAITFLQFVLFSGIITFVSAGSELSTCDLMHPKTPLGKPIIIAARALFTRHGTFLTSDTCSDHSQDIVILYPKLAGTPEVSFELDSQAIDLLKSFFRPNGGTTSACGIFSGQVFYKRDFHSKESGGGPQGNGFGPRGAFRLAFVLRSVNEIRSCK
jgi:hypothetical protein